MLKCYRALEIYISGQVDTLNKTFKLSYTSKVFLKQLGTETCIAAAICVEVFVNSVHKVHLKTDHV